jgi:hypothetical protein
MISLFAIIDAIIVSSDTYLSQRGRRRRARLLAAGLDVRGRAAAAVDRVKEAAIGAQVRHVLGAEHETQVGTHLLLVLFQALVQLLNDYVDVVVAALALFNLGHLADGERLVRLAHALAQLRENIARRERKAQWQGMQVGCGTGEFSRWRVQTR